MPRSWFNILRETEKEKEEEEEEEKMKDQVTPKPQQS